MVSERTNIDYDALDFLAEDIVDTFTVLRRLMIVAYLKSIGGRDELTLEQYQEREKNAKLVKEILADVTNGQLVKKSNNSLLYEEKGLSKDIACKNIASGLKPFLMIKRMVENGTQEAERVLIIDESEVNLHPVLQLKFAKVLVLLNKELNLQILISTHSPYIL